MSGWRWVGTCVHVFRYQRTYLGIHSSDAIHFPVTHTHLFFFFQILTCSLPSRLGQLVAKSHGSPCVRLPSTGITRTCHHNFFPTVFLKSEHRSSYLQGSSLLTDLPPSPQKNPTTLYIKVHSGEKIYRNNTRGLTITKILNKFD